MFISCPNTESIFKQYLIFLRYLNREKIVHETIQSQPIFGDPQVLWLSVKERIPNIAKLALNCINAVSNSAAAERSFSLYSLILSARRKSLSEKNLKALCFLDYNLNENIRLY
ncbi:unnamed protein product [Natator depressus]